MTDGIQRSLNTAIESLRSCGDEWDKASFQGRKLAEDVIKAWFAAQSSHEARTQFSETVDRLVRESADIGTDMP